MKVQEIYTHKANTSLTFPLATSTVSAGFASAVENYMEKRIDLNEALIAHPAATFFVKVEGDSMIGAGIMNGDLLIVDRALDAASGKIIVAVINGEFTVKRLKKVGKRLFLQPENVKYHPIEITKESEFLVWGVVTYAIHPV